jgi:hypothetical protein
MSQIKQSFRRQLLDMESTNSTLQERYESEVKAMIEKQLVGREKAGHILGLALGLWFLIGFGSVAIFMSNGLPLFARASFVLGALFGAAFAAMEIVILRKGTINLKTDSIAAAGMSWGFVVIIMTIFLVNADKFPDPTRMLAAMIIFEIMAGLGLLKAYIERSEVNTQEKLLEIEYQIAALTEKLGSHEATE